MRNNNYLAAVLFLTICSLGFVLIPQYKFKPNNKPQHKIPKRDRMDLAWAQEIEMTMDPELGEVPKERLLAAYAYKQELLKRMGKAAIPNVNWVERGPNNCGGRTRSILVDLNDATRKTIWAGSVAGGLWKTTDITAAAPNWTNVNEFFDNMAITSITQAPGNPQIMYFGTGEGNGNIDAVRGLGVWKSSNGGVNWTQLSSTNNSNFYFCQKVFAIGNGDTVFVCAQTGLYRSVNGGTTFTKVLGTGTAGALGNESEDIERMPNGVLYASMSGSGANTGTIHKSTNNGLTWSTPLTINGGINKREIELGVADNDTNVIWGLVETGSRIRAIIRSVNAGASFDTTTAYPNDADGGIPDTDFSRGQAWYDLSIAVDPNNSSVCFVGGIDLFKTTNGGSSWQQISHWYGGFSFQEVHADQHIALFEPGNSSVIYFGNDGGVYRSTNATATIPTITSKERNYNTTQFYACDIHPTAGNNYFLAGAQDNGSHRFNQIGMNSTVEVTGGDGAFCHIDQNEPNFQFTSYTYNTYNRSTNGGGSFSGTGLSFGSQTGRFINPTDYDDSLNIFYAPYSNGTFLRWDNPQTGNTNTLVSVTAFNNAMVSAVTVSPNVTGRVYFGVGGRLIRVDNANTATGTVAGLHVNNVTGMPTGYLNCIEVERGNENHIVIVYTNYGITNIWETRNGGTTWDRVDGNLPDMPIRWVLLNPNRPFQALIATELGVWSTDSLNGLATNWQPSNSGLSNTRVDMLKMRRSDNFVVAGTHGRGLYTSDVFAQSNPNIIVSFQANNRVTYPGNTIQFLSSAIGATTYLWDFGDGTTSTSANPVKTYLNSGVYNVSLTVNGGTGSKTENNFIRILPYRGVPYTAANGGNFDVNTNDFGAVLVNGTPFELGSSVVSGKSGTFSGSNAWVTGVNSATYADNSEAYLYTPSFNCTAAGNYTLSFFTKYKTENTYDGFRIEYSINHGLTWLPLGTTTATNWYNYANPSTGRPFPQNEAFFSSATTMNSFALRTFTTSLFAGQNKVTFRFAFKSDVTVNDAGVAIDNFELSGPVNQPVPVTLTWFNAKRNENQVELNWQTSSEKNNKGFEVYRKDATNTWVLVTFVAGKKNSNVLVNYSYQDAEAPQDEVVYYKLKQIDFDGQFEWSKEVAVAPVKIKQNATLMNVWMKEAKVFGISVYEPQTAIWIYNQFGQLMQQLTVDQYAHEIDLSGFKAGIYYLHVSAGNKQQVIKIVVL